MSPVWNPCRRALTFVMIWLVLTTCILCPVMQMLDRWDHEFQTGQDSESAFVVIVLCLGAALVLARAVIYMSKALPERAINTVCNITASFQRVLRSDTATFLSTSPPSAVLR